MQYFQIFVAILLFCSPALAGEKKADLADFILPIPPNFTTSATSAMKASGRDMSDYFKAMGILFPEGAKVELDNVKGVLAARLTHDQALRVIQIINAFIGDSSGKLTKEVFGAGELNKSPLKDD